MLSARRAGALLAVLVAVAAAGELGLWVAARAHPRLTIDVGPATGPYLRGFSPSVEFPPITARWLLGHGQLALPLDVVPGTGRIWMHVALREAAPQPLGVRVAGEPAAQFTFSPALVPRAPPLPGRAANDPFGDTRVANALFETRGGAFQIDFDGLSAPVPALAVDWVRLEGLAYHVPLRALAPRLIGLGLCALAFVYTGSLARAALFGGAGAALSSLAAAHDPFLLVHLAAKVAVPGLVLSCLVAPWLRRRAHGGALAVLLLGGFLLKGAGIFHPALTAPDVLTHNRYVAAWRSTSGSFAVRTLAAQKAARVAYLRVAGGEHHAFPYSPVYYLPFTLLPEDRVVGAMKYLALLAAVAETGLVFLLAGQMLDPRLGLWAATLATFLSPMHARLVWAMWPAITGHLADALVLVALYAWLRQPDARARRVLLALAVLAAFCSYVSGPVLIGTLLVAAALIERRQAAWLLLVLVSVAALSASVVYAAYARGLFALLWPASSGMAGAAVEPGVGAATSLGRWGLFYGWAYPLLAGVGLWSAARFVGQAELRFLRIYALTALLLVLARMVAGDLLRGLKDMLFAGPLVVLLTSLALRLLLIRGVWARRTAYAVVLALVLQGLFQYWSTLAPQLTLVAPS